MKIQAVGLIKRKDKPNLYCDASQVKDLVNDLNSNDFVYLDLYQCTIHKYDIDEIKVVRMTTQIDQDLKKTISKRITPPTQSLSLNQYLAQCSSNQALWVKQSTQRSLNSLSQ